MWGWRVMDVGLEDASVPTFNKISNAHLLQKEKEKLCFKGDTASGHVDTAAKPPNLHLISYLTCRYRI